MKAVSSLLFYKLRDTASSRRHSAMAVCDGSLPSGVRTGSLERTRTGLLIAVHKAASPAVWRPPNDADHRQTGKYWPLSLSGFETRAEHPALKRSALFYSSMFV